MQVIIKPSRFLEIQKINYEMLKSGGSLNDDFKSNFDSRKVSLIFKTPYEAF